MDCKKCEVITEKDCKKCEVLKERDRLLEEIDNDTLMFLAITSLLKLKLEVPQELLKKIELRVIQ